jgi:hypothetical protein
LPIPHILVAGHEDLMASFLGAASVTVARIKGAACNTRALTSGVLHVLNLRLVKVTQLMHRAAPSSPTRTEVSLIVKSLSFNSRDGHGIGSERFEIRAGNEILDQPDRVNNVTQEAANP